MKATVVTVSDTRRIEDDRSGARLVELVSAAGHPVTHAGIVPDDRERIVGKVVELLAGDVDLVIVTGGTGIAPRDVTPEAVVPLFEKSIDGFGEEFRRRSIAQIGPRGMLSRAALGVAKGKLVGVLPGSTKAVELGAELLLAIAPHAIDLARGKTAHGAP